MGPMGEKVIMKQTVPAPFVTKVVNHFHNYKAMKVKVYEWPHMIYAQHV